MQVYYVNRDDRPDRNYLFRGAMAAMGFRPEELIRVDAMKREDYPTRDLVCDAAIADRFEGFFTRMKERDYPGYGTVVQSWSYMRAWRTTAEGDAPALFLTDDYYVKQPKQALDLLLAPLDDFNIVQLAWHVRDDVFFLDHYDLGIPYEHVPEQVSSKSPYFLEGAWHGCSDWAIVFSPFGAERLLHYMETECPINNECAITAMQHTYRDMEGIYSLKDQPRDVNGNQVLRTNPWIGHLIEYTEGDVSDMMGTHLIPDMKPEDQLWDERMEDPYGSQKESE